MTTGTGKEMITIHTLSNISRSKTNQIMKLGQLIEHDMRNIFLEKSYTNNVVEKLVKDPFLKNQNTVYI